MNGTVVPSGNTTVSFPSKGSIRGSNFAQLGHIVGLLIEIVASVIPCCRISAAAWPSTCVRVTMSKPGVPLGTDDAGPSQPLRRGISPPGVVRMPEVFPPGTKSGSAGVKSPATGSAPPTDAAPAPAIATDQATAPPMPTLYQQESGSTTLPPGVWFLIAAVGLHPGGMKTGIPWVMRDPSANDSAKPPVKVSPNPADT